MIGHTTSGFYYVLLPTSWRDPKRFWIWHSGWHTWETLLFVIGKKQNAPSFSSLLPQKWRNRNWMETAYVSLTDFTEWKKRNFVEKKIPLGDVWGNGLLWFSLDCWVSFAVSTLLHSRWRSRIWDWVISKLFESTVLFIDMKRKTRLWSC